MSGITPYRRWRREEAPAEPELVVLGPYVPVAEQRRRAREAGRNQCGRCLVGSDATRMVCQGCLDELARIRVGARRKVRREEAAG